MPTQKRGLVATVRRELAEARCAARTGVNAALAARQAAVAQLESARKSAPARRLALGAARDEACREAQDRLKRETEALDRALSELANAAAPGRASSPFKAWRTAEHPGDESASMLRIGALGSLPALVPLLDQAHLELTGDDGVISGLLLRALACTTPGSLRITVYDPGQLDIYEFHNSNMITT